MKRLFCKSIGPREFLKKVTREAIAFGFGKVPRKAIAKGQDCIKSVMVKLG